MNKPITSLFTALIGLFLFYNAANAQCPGNLLANPGFESGTDGWTTLGAAAITTDAHSGSKAISISGNSYASVGQALPVSASATYTATLWTKGVCFAEIRFLNSAWAPIYGGNGYGLSNTTYQQTTITATAPSGAAYVYLLVSKDSGTGFKVDDACLILGSGNNCAISPTISNIVCSNSNTPSIPTDDVYSIVVNATNPAGGTGYQIIIPQLGAAYSGTYGTPLNIQYLPISAGVLTLNFTDNTTPSCTATTSVTPPPPCSVAGLPELNGNVSEIIPAVNNCYTPPGQPFTFMSMQINNMGDVAATAFKVKFYFSTDNALSASDVLWSTVNLPSLNVMSNGGPAFIGPGQPVPASLPPGKYYVIVTIDGDNQVAESNEANNIITPFTVEIGAADVSLVSYSGLPATVAAGSSFPVQVTVKYLSNGYPQPASTSFAAQIFLADVTPPILVGSVNYTVGDFAQSSTVTKTIQVNLPANMATGSRNFHITAEYNFCQDPTNNSQFQSVNVTPASGSGIDLELSLAQNTANPVIYSHYTTTATLINKGPQAATGVKMKWAKPAGVVYTGGNEFTASQGSFNPNGDQIWTVGSIPANGSATLTVSYFLLQNGAPVTYAQVSAANETDVDSQPNNGTPPTPNQDDEASTGGSTPPVLTPDLTISNLVIGNTPVQSGQVLTYNFDLANIGNGNAPGNFNVKAWISTLPYFNTSGIQDGIVPTGNFNAGFSVSGVPGASTIPANLADGQYYLHLLVDADNVVSEINESNNSATASFVVHGLPQPGNCDELLGPGMVTCLSHDANGQLEVVYKPATDLRKAVMDGMGQPISDVAFGPDPSVTSYQINLGKLEKMVGQTVVYSKTIPTAILNEYNYIVGFTEFNTGFVLFGYKTATASTYALRTNANLEVLQTALLTTSYNGTPPNVYNTGQLSPNEIRFVLKSQPGQQISEANTLYVMNGDLTVASTELLTSAIFSGGVTLVPNACGDYSMVIFRQINFCTHGACYEQERRQGRFVNGHFVTDASYLMNEFSSLGSGTLTRIWKLRTNDGGLITGNVAQQVYLGQPNSNVPIHLKKTLGNATVWEKDINVASVNAVRWLAMSGNELVFLSEKVNAVFVEALNCLETPAPPTGCAAINVTTGPKSLTIANATAPHVLIKVFNPNWTLNSMCLDNCANPFILNNLNAGVYHLQIKLLNNGWGEICYLEQDVNVSSFGGGNGTSIARADDRLRLSLDRFYPSPTSYQVTVDVFSPIEQAATLDFYDQMGRVVHSMKVQMEKGVNFVPVLVYDWKSGPYNVIARGEETGLPAYGRFLKVWEE